VLTIVILCVMALIILFGFMKMLPDIIRYMKIRAMSQAAAPVRRTARFTGRERLKYASIRHWTHPSNHFLK
jgi:hypothetical protein